jgi:hypothetical protein
MTQTTHLGRGRAKLRAGDRRVITRSTPRDIAGVAGGETDVGSFGGSSVSSSLWDGHRSNGQLGADLGERIQNFLESVANVTHQQPQDLW